MKNNILLWRYFLYFVLAGAIFFVLWQGIVPFGKIAYKTDLFSYNDFIKPLSPKDRVILNKGDNSATMIADPVYFNLRTSRKFSQAKLKFLYKNLSQAPVLRAGVLVDPSAWRYYLQTFENKLIDQVNLAWESQDSNKYILFTRPGADKLFSLDEFLKEPPASDKIAIYEVDLGLDFLIADYEPNKDEQLFLSNMAGSYQLFTYIKDENLFFSFDFRDLNINEKTDDIDLFLYYKNHVIDSRHLSGSSCLGDKCSVEMVGNLSFILSDLPEGVYRIELRTSNDIITNKIKTTQSKFTFRDKLVFSETEVEEISLFTNINNLKVKSLGPDLLQDIRYNNDVLSISKPYQQFSFDLSDDNLSELVFKPSGIELAGHGLFAFSKDLFFDPQIKKLNKAINLDKLNIDYIVSSYKPRDLNIGWRQAELNIDLSSAYRDNGNYAFMISAPGISGNNATSSIESGVLIKNISVELEGVSVLEKLHKIYDKN